MKQMISLFCVAITLSACAQNEGVAGFADPDAVYRMTLLDGEPFAAPVTIAFPQPGIVQGHAPCNQFNAAQTVPYPWFGLERVTVTRRACPALADEATFFAALEAVTLAEITGDILILSNPAGREMVFEAL